MPYKDLEAHRAYHRANSRAWRAAHPEEHRAYHRAYNVAHREERAVYNRARVRCAGERLNLHFAPAEMREVALLLKELRKAIRNRGEKDHDRFQDPRDPEQVAR